jgi:FtsP/CotA-like multicopper oxidase with cupredoxin domain
MKIRTDGDSKTKTPVQANWRYYRVDWKVALLLSAVLLALLNACMAPTPADNATPAAPVTSVPAAPAPVSPAAPVRGCEIQDYTLTSTGAGAPFQEPDVISSTNGVLSTTLTVEYAVNKIADCTVQLRSYNGKLVGPTLRVRPGETLNIKLVNDLPDGGPMHVMNTIGDLNHTNLHTHGLHVSPAGNSDNVLLDIGPGQTFQYEIKIPLNQVPGTYWYHAHLHGSTATQVSSGMEGALIVMGDAIPNTADALPEIKQAAEKIFVFQQIVYDEAGLIEPTAKGGGTFPNSPDPNNPITYFGPCNWEPMKREHTINGQLFPVLTLARGEVQRWRLIDAGIRESIGVELHGPYTGTGTLTITDALKLPTNGLNEIAVDGISLNKVNAWQQVELEPGYRSDVLVQLDQPGTYYLVDNAINLRYEGTDTNSQALTCPSSPEQPSFLATVVVSGSLARPAMALPTSAQLARYAPPQRSIFVITTTMGLSATLGLTSTDELTNAMGGVQTIIGAQHPITDRIVMSPTEPIAGFQLMDFTVTAYVGNLAFSAADHPFSPDRPRQLKLGNTEMWVLNTRDDSLYYAHPFHIHVNPFQTWRYGPDGMPESVWRDTLMVQRGKTEYAFTRYQDYIGAYVYHCHILDHEDQGMMELVEIVQ